LQGKEFLNVNHIYELLVLSGRTYWRRSEFQDVLLISAAVWMRSALFRDWQLAEWHIRRFGTTYLSYIEGSKKL